MQKALSVSLTSDLKHLMFQIPDPKITLSPQYLLPSKNPKKPVISTGEIGTNHTCKLILPISKVKRAEIIDSLQEEFPTCDIKFGNQEPEEKWIDFFKKPQILHLNSVPHYLDTSRLISQLNLLKPVPKSKKVDYFLHLIGAGLCTQLGSVVFLTYELGWDLMEPVTCLMGIATSIIGAIFYKVFRKEFTYQNTEIAAKAILPRNDKELYNAGPEISALINEFINKV